MEPEKESTWTVDKHIPVALIFAVFIQTASGFWWASRMDLRVEQLETIQRSTPNPTDRIVRLEVKLESITDRLNEIKSLLTPKPHP